MMFGWFSCNTTDSTSTAETAHPSRAPEFIPVFSGLVLLRLQIFSVQYVADYCLSFFQLQLQFGCPFRVFKFFGSLFTHCMDIIVCQQLKHLQTSEKQNSNSFIFHLYLLYCYVLNTILLVIPTLLCTTQNVTYNCCIAMYSTRFWMDRYD